ncbi:unnamed protein product [Oppiella nova]|uniref:DEP domain-containing protein n=1 Tax=Oppiella nova TaxID=334625 RepID=A0A7R9QD55_9ACAR|nr:unnamed protein product [Oppiella nova]CAG2162925.1 unnamed protein product [Oppiella nova]
MSCLMLSFLKWNQVLHSFYIGITPKKHRKHMRTHYNCFVATDAVDWILNYLQFSPHFAGQQISRFQAINLLRKYLETDVIERVDARKAGQQFQDNKELYRFTRQANENLPFISSSNLNPKQMPSTPKSLKSDDQIPELIKQMSLTEKSDAFKEIFFDKLVAFVPNVDDFVRRDDIISLTLMHNMTRVSANGVVRLTDRTEDLPHWVVSAMKCLANWPKASGSDSCLPKYPGFENDVFAVVRDYFINIGIPLIPNQLYALITHIYDKHTASPTFASINHRLNRNHKPKAIEIPTPILCCQKQQNTSTPIVESQAPTTVELPPNHVFETVFMGETPVTKIVSIDELNNLFANNSRIKSCDSFCDKYSAINRQTHQKFENSRYVEAITTIPRNRRQLLYKSPITENIYKSKYQSPESSAGSPNSYYNFGFAMQSPTEDGEYMESKSVSSLSSIHMSPVSRNSQYDNLSAQFSKSSNNSSDNSNTIVNQNSDKLVESLRLSLFLMPSPNRRHLHLLLRLLLKIIQNKEIHFRFYENISIKEYILKTFTRSILCAQKESSYNEMKAQKIVCLLLDNCKDMFKVPEDVVEGVDRLLVERAKKSLFGDNQDLQYCQKVTADEFELQRDVMSEYALADLLKSIMTDDRLSDRDKLKWIKQVLNLLLCAINDTV